MRKKMFLGVALAAMLVLSGCNLRDALGSKDVGAVKAKEIAGNFIKDALVAPGTNVNIKEVVKESGAYKIVVAIKAAGQDKEQEITSYLSTDGKKFFP
ncbi:MAG: hypothetical protein NTZ97_04350, partial [Candidatus Moranbacteria bacterium]|nr:hypothetical protein [Candidatus Moranbacteria bacterium]